MHDGDPLLRGRLHRQRGTLILTVNRGVSEDAQALTGDELFGIACRASACTAVGEIDVPVGVPPKDMYYGTLVNVSGGKVTSTQLDGSSGGFNSVARAATVSSVPRRANPLR